MDEEIRQNFQKIGERFDIVEKRLEDTNERLDKTNEKVDKLADAVQSGFLEVGKRFDKVEAGVAEVKTDLGDFKMTVKNQYPDKSYLDNKLSDLAAEIGRRIERNKEKEMRFKKKIIEIFKRNSLVSDEESQKLEELL